MKAKKHLGQHFLTDKAVIFDIIESIKNNCKSETPLLEVGPGQGVLTYELAEHYPAFRAVEFDRDMIAILKQGLDNNILINENFLTLELDPLFEGQEFNLVGNYPYNISSQIIFKMLANVERIPMMIGMFQKEVAERITAKSGTRGSGIISLRTQVYYDTELLFHIAPGAFSPPPKVDSSIIMLTRKENYGLPCDEKLFNQIIKTSFQQRRKKLRNTLKPFLNNLDLEILQLRPEQIGVEDFINITQIITLQKEEK